MSEKHEISVRLRVLAPNAGVTSNVTVPALDAGVAQLVERLVANEKVAGSNPVSRSHY